MFAAVSYWGHAGVVSEIAEQDDPSQIAGAELLADVVQYGSQRRDLPLCGQLFRDVLRVRCLVAASVQIELPELTSRIAVEDKCLQTIVLFVAQPTDQVVLLLFAKQCLHVLHSRRGSRRVAALPRIDHMIQSISLLLREFVFDRHAVGSVEHEIQQRPFSVRQRDSQYGICQCDEQQGQKKAAADCQCRSHSQRPSLLVPDVEQQRGDDQTDHAEEHPELSLDRPRRSKRRIDLVDRRDVVQTEKPAEYSCHVLSMLNESSIASV